MFLEGLTSRLDNTHIHNSHIRNVVHAILPDIVRTLRSTGPSNPQSFPPRPCWRWGPAIVRSCCFMLAVGGLVLALVRLFRFISARHRQSFQPHHRAYWP